MSYTGTEVHFELKCLLIPPAKPSTADKNENQDNALVLQYFRQNMSIFTVTIFLAAIFLFLLLVSSICDLIASIIKCATLLSLKLFNRYSWTMLLLLVPPILTQGKTSMKMRKAFWIDFPPKDSNNESRPRSLTQRY